jgi:hypothetical protein
MGGLIFSIARKRRTITATLTGTRPKKRGITSLTVKTCTVQRLSLKQAALRAARRVYEEAEESSPLVNDGMKLIRVLSM